MSLRLKPRFQARESVLEIPAPQEGDLTALQPKEFITWANKQTSHQLLPSDKKAILKEGISGLVFLQFGNQGFLAGSGICRGSVLVLGSLRSKLLKNKRTITEAGLDKPTDNPSKRTHTAESSGDTVKSEEDRKRLAENIDRAIALEKDSKPREEAAKAKERHSQVLEHFQQNFHSLDDAAKQLSSPHQYLNLPFPYAGQVLPQRFKRGDPNQNTFWYMGREDFTTILDSFLDVLRGSNVLDLWVYGPIGHGKSHLLATITYCLTAQGRKVIYLPDCRLCETMTFSYVQTAMFFTWANDPATIERIISFQSLKDIERFLRLNRDEVIFVIDQVNALDEDDKSQETTKTRIRQWLDLCRAKSRTLLGTSANNLTFRKTRHQQKNEKTIHVHGGFTDTEMVAWWERNKGINMQGYSRAEMEDFTGRMPLLLDSCSASGILQQNAPEIESIMRQARRFVSDMKNKLNDRLWDQYQSYVRGCIAGNSVDDTTPEEVIDHRYFYDVDGVGQCVCGAVRNTVTKQLIALGDEPFTSREVLDAIDRWIGNASVIGFFLERAVLRSIATRGILDLDIRGPIIQHVFRKFPEYDMEKKLALYIPAAYNHPAIDALVLHLVETDEEKTAHLYPIQITIADRHKDSEKEFFLRWDKWCQRLDDDYNVRVTFLWIHTTEQYTTKVVEEKTRPTRSEPQPLNPQYDVVHIPLAQVNAEAWNRYKRAKNRLDHPRK